MPARRVVFANMTDLADVGALSVDERLKLIEDLWDSIDTELVPLPDWHRAELDRRLDALEQGASAGATVGGGLPTHCR
jgi:putative addiction module component (TIGR02574 family)